MGQKKTLPLYTLIHRLLKMTAMNSPNGVQRFEPSTSTAFCLSVAATARLPELSDRIGPSHNPKVAKTTVLPKHATHSAV